MTINAIDLLKQAVTEGASDLFIVAGLPVSMRRQGNILRIGTDRLLPDDTQSVISQIYELADRRSMSVLNNEGDDDFSFAVPGLSRFRVSAYKQRNTLSVVVRIITFTLPNPSDLGIPDKIIDFAKFPKGMVLITGAAGSGKSTSLACIIDYINRNYSKHIITLEDPVEFLHRHDKSIVSQREINVDTESYVTALRAALRQSPNVILLGEMRDYETIQVAMTAAETGHLVFSTLHTIGAANTIDRIIDVFPPSQQDIGHIVHRHIICNVMNQRHSFPHLCNDTFFHVLPPSTLSRAIGFRGEPRKKRTLLFRMSFHREIFSLRWHYPNQVPWSTHGCALSACLQAPIFHILFPSPEYHTCAVLSNHKQQISLVRFC